MSGRRLSLVHTVAEDLGPESGSPTLARNGQAVSGYATFYVKTTGWNKIPPGRLGLADLWGGASGFGNAATGASTFERPQVEFYLGQNPLLIDSFVALNGTVGDIFTFGFFGRRFS